MDWIGAVKEILYFKDVPDKKRIFLVATQFRGRATTWWQQLKVSLSRARKEKIALWEKLKKHMKRTFLPYNYIRNIYQHLQKLRQSN